MLFVAPLFVLACEEPDVSSDESGAVESCTSEALGTPYGLVAPSRGEVFVLDLSGEPTSRQLLARTLQGVVNREVARLYIVDDVADPVSAEDSQEATEFWLTEYEEQYGVASVSRGTLDDALSRFWGDLDGYFLVSEDEPWTVNVGSSAAGAFNAVVATANEAAELDSYFLPEVDDFTGDWPDAATAYAEVVERIPDAAYPGFAVMRTEKLRTRDFMVQQGILELGGLPGSPEWASVARGLELIPDEVAVYGYTAEDGFQELDSVTQISAAGDVLVPSDSAANLSFHMAVAPSEPSLPAPPADLDVDCATAEQNVVIGLSDGDNLVVATTLYPTSRYWLSPERGQIPISWSISPALSEFAPGVLDYYARTVAPNDELVAMIGPGYAYGGEMPNSDWFYGLGFQMMEQLGLRVLWLFDPSESGSGTYSWGERAKVGFECGTLTGLLDGYYPPLFHEAPETERVGGVPVARALGSYDDKPADIAQHIRDLLALPKEERPDVAFFSASAWNNDVAGLVEALTPLEQEGARFLSASAGLGCVREPG